MRRAALAALLLLLVAAPLAAAHATLVGSEPARGARLAAPPERATVRFSESADPGGTYVHVEDAHGVRVDLDDLRYQDDPPQASVGLPADLPAGPYLLRWQALSGRDGHTTSGAVGFAIGDHEPPASSQSSADTARPWAVVARVLLYAGFSLAFGGIAFLAWMPAASHRHARPAVALGAGLHLVGVLLLARETATWSNLALDAFLATGTGQLFAFRAITGAAAALVAGLALLRPTRTAAPATLLLLGAAALAGARLGHASDNGPAFIGLDFLHLAAAAAWVGGLVLYASWLLRGEGAAAPGVGARFGTLALTAVALLGFTGVLLAVAILGADMATHPGQALQAAWAQFLVAKVAIFLLMLLVGGVNRYVMLEPERTTGAVARLQRTVRALSGGHLRAGLADGRRLGHTIATEAIVGVAVLLLASLLTSVSPPRAEAGPEPLTLEAQGDFSLVRITFDAPPRLGATGHALLQVTDEDGHPVQNDCGRAACVAVEVAYQGGATERRPVALDNGTAYVHSIVWAAAGPATLTVTVSTQAHFEDTAAVHFTVEAGDFK